MQDTPIRTIDKITDSELEDCFDGCTDIEMVRRLVGECTDEQGWIDSLDFGDCFAPQIQGFIDADQGSEDYEEAWEANRQWGENIAENINDSLSREEPEEYQD